MPVSIDSVPYYKITGHYCFKGDLIFTRNGLYFFPHTDLEKRREQIREALEYISHLAVVETLIGSIIRRAAHLLLPLAYRSVNTSTLRAMGVWNEGDSSELLSAKLDQRLAELKHHHVAGQSLPVPLRVTRDEIANLRIGAMGVLSFDAQSDRHDFSVGLMRKRALREALCEGGFTTAPPGN